MQSQCHTTQIAINLVGHFSIHATDAFTQMSESPGYFCRECEVLQEISHPRIVKLLRKIEESEEEKKSSPEASPFCVVLEYCSGPTLEQMLKYGGAIGGIYIVAREVAAQLVDAVSFLRGRGVIH